MGNKNEASASESVLGKTVEEGLENGVDARVCAFMSVHVSVCVCVCVRACVCVCVCIYG